MYMKENNENTLIFILEDIAGNLSAMKEELKLIRKKLLEDE